MCERETRLPGQTTEEAQVSISTQPQAVTGQRVQQQFPDSPNKQPRVAEHSPWHVLARHNHVRLKALQNTVQYGWCIGDRCRSWMDLQ